MILKELNDLYDRLIKQGVQLPCLGYNLQKISFRVVIDLDGNLIRMEDAREEEIITKKTKKGVTQTSKLVMREMLVPGSGKPSGSGITPCFLCDKGVYMVGYNPQKEREKKCFAEFRRLHLEKESEINSIHYSAVCRFLESWDPTSEESKSHFSESLEGYGIFCIAGDGKPVHCNESVDRWWKQCGCKIWPTEETDSAETNSAVCLVSGEVSRIARLHKPLIKGVMNAQTSGAALVSFQPESFRSYGKSQSENAPVSDIIASKYCNALNYLLSRRASKVYIADTTTVFWTDAPEEKYSDIELLMGGCIDPGRLDAQDDELVSRIRNTLLEIVKGHMPGDMLHTPTRYCILGLSANAARLSVRFYTEGNLADLFENMKSHFEALSLQKRNVKFKDPDLISPFLILRQTAREADDIAPLLSGALMNAILFRKPYPDTIASAIIRRFRADGDINYVRCAFLKAWLLRKNSNYHITPMLDDENNQPGYVLGRLFALLQKTQADGHPNLNRTIQDAFYSSASATPGTVFPRLLKLYRHHVAKLSNQGMKITREKQVQHVMSKLTYFPAHMNLEQQGLFALGFYHQTQDFYTSSDNN